jgi:hypothetical protein
MNKQEYLSVIKNHIANATCESLRADNDELLKRYDGELYGYETPEGSKVVSNDVQDTVEADMPVHARVFLGGSEICSFKPLKENEEEEIKEAQQKTKYIDWIVRGQKKSFKVNYDFLKDVETYKYGVLKFYIEDKKNTRTESFQDHSPEEIAAVLESLKGENVSSVDIIERGEENEKGGIDLKVRVTTEDRKVVVTGVPVNNLLLTVNAEDEEDATLIGEEMIMTRGDLLASGYSVSVVKSLNTKSKSTAAIEFNEDGTTQSGDFADWSNEKILVEDFLVKIDKDADGIAERRHIVKSGDTILEDEPFEMVNYVVASAIPESHSAIGKGRGEIAVHTAEVKTAILRGFNNNLYNVISPQIGINDNVEQDDLIVKRTNGIVRVDGEESPANSIFPFNVEFIGDKALLGVQYYDQAKAVTSGNHLASQGLSADDFSNETASRFNGIKEAGAEKIELVARVIGDAYAKLYNGIAWLVSTYQTTEVEMMVLGEPLSINPSEWKYNQTAVSTVGLGSGDGTKKADNLSAILNILMLLKGQNSTIVDDQKIYNTLNKMLKAVDINDTKEFYNNPEQPQELLKAQNEQLIQVVQQLQAQAQNNPLAEAEQVRAQASLIKAQSATQLKGSEIAEKARQHDDKIDLDLAKHNDKVALELTKLEADTGKNIEGSII